ncbi:MAG: flotillin-like protein FloA [Planctomycetota bacterium]
MPNYVIYGLIAIIALVLLVFFAVISQFIGLWIRAFFSNVRVSIFDLVGVQLRKIPPATIVNARIQATRAGLEISQSQMETHILAGGDLIRVIRSMIAADKANIDLPWDTSTAIDLAGRDVLAAIQTSVDPKVIDVPSREMGVTTLDAVAADGIQLKVKARVTVRTNIKRLVGGATEETIVARVGEGIVSSIGSADDHRAVLKNPDVISKSVLSKGLDANTAFEILSIDIADVSVGENIGAKIMTDQAEADKKRAQAEAEKRRALAVALEQENVAKVAENRALVVLAEAEVPRAMAEAFRSGNLGVMDYFKMQNVQADTQMREAVADRDDNPRN